MNQFPGAASTYTKIINTLIAARKAKRLKQEDVARAMGKTPQAISLYETMVNNPSIVETCRWAAFLGVSILVEMPVSEDAEQR